MMRRFILVAGLVGLGIAGLTATWLRNGPVAQRSVVAETESCKAEKLTSPKVYGKLVELLEYDRGPGGMDIRIFQDKAERLVVSGDYYELKTMIAACAPQFREIPYSYKDPAKVMALKATLTRSSVTIRDDRDGKKFVFDTAILKAI
jgi:hypothetical protein